MSSVPAARSRALLVAVLLLPFAALMATPTALAWYHFTEDWESGYDGWTFAGSFSSVDCTTRYAGSCSLKLAPPCALNSGAFADFGNRGSNWLALSFMLKPSSFGGDTHLTTEVAIVDYWGNAAGKLSVYFGWNDGMSLQLFSQGYGASTQVNVPNDSGWYLVSLRIESMDRTAWVDVFKSTGARLTGTSKVTWAPNAEASSVRFFADSPLDVNDPTCIARAFHIDNVRLGDSIPERPAFPAAAATRNSIGLSWYGATDPGTTPITSYRVWRSMDGGAETEVGSTTGTSYTDSNLVAGATYTYRVKTRNYYGDSPFSDTSATAVTWGFGEDWETSGAGWTFSSPSAWTECSGAPTGCMLLLAPQGNGVATEVSHVLNQAMTGRFQAAFGYNVTPLADAADARLVVAFDGPTWQGSSAILHLSDGPTGLGLRVQSGSASESVAHTVAPQEWTDVALVVEPQSDVAWAEVRDADGNVLVASATVPIPASVSVIKTLSFASTASGPDAHVARVDALRTGYLPGAPTNLDGAGGPRQTSLKWVAPTELGSGTLTGYRLYRALPGQAAQPIATLPSGTTTYTDTGLENDTTYEYTVSAITTTGLGPRSASKLVRTDRVNDGFEPGLGAWVVSDPASATQSCTLARSGSCSLRLAPATRGVWVDVTRPLQSPISGPIVATGWFRTDRVPAATDVTMRLAFADGKTADVELLRSAQATNDVWRHNVGGYAQLLPRGLTANAWYQVTLHFSPDSGRAKTEIRDASGGIVSMSSVNYFNSGWWTGADLVSFGVHVKSAATGTPAIVHVDDLRVHESLMSLPSIHTWKLDSAVGVRWWGGSGTTPATGYRIYAAPAGGTWKAVADRTPHARGWDEMAVRNLADGTALVNGNTYCFAVSVLTAWGEWATSGYQCETPQAVPDAPRNLRAAPGANKVTLNWEQGEYAGDPAATETCIYRGTNTHTTPRIEIKCVPYGQLSYVDTTAVGGVKYYYSVRAKNTKGLSDESNLVMVTPTLT